MAEELIDLDRLGPYLERTVPGFRGLRTARKFPGGQSNPTFLLRAESGRYVLRRKPPGELLKSAHAVDREFRVQAALADSAVPVARMHHLCTDETVIGAMFFVMDYVHGRSFWDPRLPDLDPPARRAIYAEMNRVLAAIHSVDLKATGLTDFGRPGNYFERQVTRWSAQYRASETEEITEMDAVMTWLGANMVPDDGRVALTHGDYRIDNLIFDTDTPRILAVMDWELSTLGHPFADLAYQCMNLRMPAGPASRGLGDVNRTALGIPTEDAYVAAYCARMGLDGIDNWDFYLVFSFFRFAAIVQGVKKRALMGNASSPAGLEIGAQVRPLAEKAFEIISRA